MNPGPSLPPLTELARRRMDTTAPPHIHFISEATADRVSRKKAKNQYNFKSEFETRREKVVDQDFGHQNNPMSQPPLELTPLGTNTTNGTTLPSDPISVRTKYPKPMSPELPTDSPGDPDADPSLSDSSNKSNLTNDRNSSKQKKKKHDKKKNLRNDKKYDSSDPSSSGDSDSS